MATVEYRANLINARFKDVKNIIAVCSGKGGVGKTFIATCLAQALRDRGFRVGLLDLDIHGFTTHRVLGLHDPPKMSEEEEPVQISGIVYFSPVVLIEERALPVHGMYKEKAVLDILACVKWPLLDYLVIDMPPGFGDEVVIPLRYLREKTHALIVATRDALSVSVVERLVDVLRSLKVNIIGAIFNFSNVFRFNAKINVDVIYEIPFIECVENVLSTEENPYEKCLDVKNMFLKVAEIVEKKVRC